MTIDDFCFTPAIVLITLGKVSKSVSIISLGEEAINVLSRDGIIGLKSIAVGECGMSAFLMGKIAL